MQPFVRRWQTGRTSATMLLVALCGGAFGAQFVAELLLNGQPAHDILREWLALDSAVTQSGHWWKFLSFGGSWRMPERDGDGTATCLLGGHAGPGLPVDRRNRRRDQRVIGDDHAGTPAVSRDRAP